MKHIIFIALLFCTFSAWAQYPTHPTKQELGRQTTGDGLTFRGSGAPAYTPTGKNNAWMFLDTLSGTLYAYRGGSWQLVNAGGVTDVSISNDTLYITTADSTFFAVFDDANTNFATDNLTFSGNRVHNLSTRTLTIADGGTYPTFQQSAATDGFTLASSATDVIAQTPGLLQIENSDTITITADRIRMNAADTRIQQVSKDNALNRVMMIDSLTGQVYYRDVSSIDSSAIKINNVANVRAYGALGNGSDATTAFQSAIATGLAVYVPPGRYLISSALTLSEGQQIFGNGDDCIVQVSANISVLRLTRRNSVSGFRIVGDLGGADTEQYGVFLDGGASYDTTHENSIKAMSFDSLGGAGIYITRTVDEYQGNLISGCTFRKNLIGVNMDTRGEYTQLSSSQFVANTTAIRVKGGNANISDCIITSNTTGISILSGDNGDHGQATGCTINHNSTGVSINGTSYGFHFLNSQMWSNSTQVNFISATNVHFIGGALSGGTISATSATNCYFSGMQFHGTVTQSLASQGVYFVNNLEGSSVGKYPTSAGDYVLRFTSPNVYEYVAAGGGGGTVSGSGTTNRVAKWSASTSLADGLLQDDGTLLSLDDASTSTAKAFKFDSWTTAARPGTPTAAMTGYNTTSGNLDFYGASAWENPVKSAVATGLGTAKYVPFYDAAGRATAGDHILAIDNLTGGPTHIRYGKSVTLTDNEIYYWFLSDFNQRTFTNSRGSTRTAETGAWRATAFYAGAHGYTKAFNLQSTAILGTGLSAASSGRAGNFNVDVSAAGTTGHSIIGVNSEATFSTATLVATGLRATSGNYAPGTTTWQRAGHFLFSNNSTGTTTLSIGADIEMTANAGTQTNVYGVRVRDITSGAQTNTPRSFYAEDPNAINVFNGRTRINSTAGPSEALHVTGKIRADTLTDTGASIAGFTGTSGTGVLTRLALGSGLSLTSGTLSSTITDTHIGNTNLTLTGTRSLTLGSNTLTFSGTTGAPSGVNFSMTPSTNAMLLQSLDGSLNNSAISITPARTQIVTTNVTGGTAATLAVHADSVTISPTPINNNNALTRILGQSASGRIGYVDKSSIAGATNLAFSGSSSPVTLTSDTGTDVIFAAGSGIALSQSAGTMTIARTYSLIHATITGGSTFFGTTAERPDNDTPGSATTSAVGSDFSVSGSTIDYTGGSGALIRVQGSISFSVADDGDYYVSMYKEGTEIGATSMRVSCVAGNYYSISLPATTTSGSTNDTFDLRIATVTGNSTTTMHRYGFIIERIY